MKKILFLFIFIALYPIGASAQQVYECVVRADTTKGTECSNLGGLEHKCQLYDGYSGSGVPDFCSGFCLNRSGIPEYCASVSVQASGNPEAHSAKKQVEEQTGINLDSIKGLEGEIVDRLSGIENEINTEDGVDAEEVEYIIGRVVSIIKDIISDNLGNTVSNAVGGVNDKFNEVKEIVVDKLPFVGNDDGDDTVGEDINGDGITDFDFDEEDPFATTGLDAVKPGGYDFDTWPDENGTKIAKIVDAYGIERYTSDGEHFYDKPYDAAHSGSGVSAAWNGAKDAISDVGDWFWKTKDVDKDKQLQDDIAREVLSDTKSKKEKDVDKAYEKYSDKIKTPAFGDVPAKAVIEVMKEVSEKDFASAAQVYIEERKNGNSPAVIRENNSTILSGGYGTFGNQGGVSQVTANKHATAVLYARYEEVYQRYEIAKELGRAE